MDEMTKPRGELLDYPEGTDAIAIDYGPEPIVVRYWDQGGNFLGDQIVFDEDRGRKQAKKITEFSPEPMPGNPPTMEQAMDLISEDDLKPQFEVHEAPNDD